MIVSDWKRIIETKDNDKLDGVVGYCDTVGGFILYVDSLDGLEVVEEIPVVDDEQWDKWD